PPAYLYLFFCLNALTPAITPLSLHDALPIFGLGDGLLGGVPRAVGLVGAFGQHRDAAGRVVLPPGGQLPGERGIGADRLLELGQDRKSTRLNSSHVKISYAVFCLKKKMKELK